MNATVHTEAMTATQHISLAYTLHEMDQPLERGAKDD